MVQTVIFFIFIVHSWTWFKFFLLF